MDESEDSLAQSGGGGVSNESGSTQEEIHIELVPGTQEPPNQRNVSEISPATPAANLTLSNFLAGHLSALQNEEMFAVVPLKTCPHLPEVQPVPESGIDHTTPCLDCSDPNENWVCLTCYSVMCGRYVNEHMMLHNSQSQHPMTLSFSDLSVWCYPCSSYVDNQILYPAKNAVHLKKFGEPMAYCYDVNGASSSGTNQHI